MHINWTYQYFTELTVDELYAIIRLRNEVFVVEQNCVFQDADNHDLVSYHICGWQDNHLVAYARIIPPGEIYPQPSIGRVVTSLISRKQHVGMDLMKKAIAFTQEKYPGMDIEIGAQLYLKSFYEMLGFIQVSDLYYEDGIKHIKMKLKYVTD